MNKPYLLILVIFLLSCKKENSYNKIEDTKSNTITSIHSKLIPDESFLGDKTCKECHADQFEEWKGSHHDKAMQIANDRTVLADFNDKVFVSQGVKSRFFKENDEFYVNTEGPDGTYQTYQIIYTFGIEPLQQYIVKFPDGHYQCLRTAWDTEKNKWFDLYPDFKVVHSEWLHWSRGGLNWNNMCADCHSTNVRKNYDYNTHSYNTEYSIINVSCEACHGPGKEHVNEVNRLGESYTNSNSLYMTSDTAPKELVDQCARCHMRREQITSNYNYSGTLLDHYSPQLIDANLYYPDGQIKDEVYVYGSFLQSKMYQNDVSCNNCHNSHSLKLKKEGNSLCTQCHVDEKYNTSEHHFHKMNTDSSKCINCHMTGKVYMGNDYRRDHSFRVPRPDLSLKYGSPNACTQCHTDKDDKWAWKEYKKLYGEIDTLRTSDKLAHGLSNASNGHKSLMQLVEDKNQPNIIRASAVQALANYEVQNSIEKYLSYLNDKSPLVRAATLDVLGSVNMSDYSHTLLPMLEDPKRSVRIKAFFALGSIDEQSIPVRYKTTYNNVKEEFLTNLNTNSDFVGSRVKKADFFLKKGNIEDGIKLYESALQIDNLNNQLRFTLANLYYRNGSFDKAEELFLTVISNEPTFGPTYYSLALLYAELERTDEAINKMELALKYNPNNIRIYYNLSLLYGKMQQFTKAEQVLIKGLKLDAKNPDLLYALAHLYYTNKKNSEAKRVVKQLLEYYPNNPQYVNFLNVVSN